MSTLLLRHSPSAQVCFGGRGARDAAQLAAHVRRIERAIPAAPAGARVLIACADRYHFSAALLASWGRGLVAVLPANGQPETIHALASGSQVVALLHDREGGGGLDVRALEREGERDDTPLALGLSLESPGLVVHTSGSTGSPMPHQKTLSQLLREPEAHLISFDLVGRRVVAAVPPYHIYGLLFGVLVPLLGGGSMSRGSPLQPWELAREIALVGADVLVAVPPHLAALAAAADVELPPLHRIFSSAGPLPQSVAEALARRGMRVTEVLGSTETGGIAYRESASEPWQPLASVRFEIAPDQALLIDSPWLAPGDARPLRTADRVEAVGSGFCHLGRSDAVVKIGGRRIDLGELETRLKQQPGVRDARVLAIEQQGVRALELVAVIEAERADPVSLRRALATHVDPVALPRRFRVVSALPRSATGKVTRRDLLALFDVATFPRELLEDGRARFAVPENLAYFRGHFDEQPILPGVVQLRDLALAEARRNFPELGALVRLSRVKFKRLVRPTEQLVVTVKRRDAYSVSFTIEAESELAASGLLHFRAEEP